MSLGLGHKYWVHLKHHFQGDLNACLDYMRDYELQTGEWFEFRNLISVLNGVAYPSTQYIVDVVEDGKN